MVLVSRGRVVEVVACGESTIITGVDVVDVAGVPITCSVDGLGSGACADTSGGGTASAASEKRTAATISEAGVRDRFNV